MSQKVKDVTLEKFLSDTGSGTVKIPKDSFIDDVYVEKGDLLIALSGATTGKLGVQKSLSPEGG